MWTKVLSFSFSTKAKLDKFTDLVQDIGFEIEWTPQVVTNIKGGGWGGWNISTFGSYVWGTIKKTDPITTTYSYFVSIKKKKADTSEEDKIKNLAQFIENGSMRWVVFEDETKPLSAFLKKWLVDWFFIFITYFVVILIIEALLEKLLGLNIWSILPLSAQNTIYFILFWIAFIQFLKGLDTYKKTSKIYAFAIPENKRKRENFMNELETYLGRKF